MANDITGICMALIGLLGLFRIFNPPIRKKSKTNHMTFSIIIATLFVVYLVQSYTYSMKLDIQKRDMVQIAQNETVYELISIEPNNENTLFHFYYRTEIDGVEGKMHKIISSENVFIIETNQCKPMIIETIVIYDYELTEFEKNWLSDKYIENLVARTEKCYEIYVPEDTLKREYNLK